MYIFLWVTDEISYDRFHANGDKIFAVHAYLEGGTDKVTFSGCPPMVGPTLKEEFPEVANSCRYSPAYYQTLATYGEKRVMQRMAFSDFSFFDIFSFPFIYGGTGEEGVKNKIVLTQTASEQLFGSGNPVGKVVRMDNRADMTVVGIIEDIPHNSSLTFESMAPVQSELFSENPNYLTTWYNNAFWTYGLLNNAEGYAKVSSGITKRIQKDIPESTNYLRTYRFEDRYLYEQNNIRNVKIFLLIGFLVLLTAILNFINLTTARSVKQAKETGLRKAIGAGRFSLIRLVYNDIAITCMIAFLLALLISRLGLPLFNQVVGKNVEFSILFGLIPLCSLMGIYLITVILSGSYPAFYLSSFTPTQTLSSNFQSSKNKGIFRNTLIISQFSISIILLACTLIISRQTNYMQQMDLGLKKDQLVYINLNGQLSSKAEALKEELGRSSDIMASSISSFLPVNIGNNGEGFSWEGKDLNFKPLVTNWEVDQDMLKTYGATLHEGRMYDKEESGIVINKTFADIIGWDSFEGKVLQAYGKEYKILGVLNDFHFNSLSQKTEPLITYYPEPGSYNRRFLVIKINTANIKNTLDYIQKACLQIEPAYPVNVAFLDDAYNQLVLSELKLQKLVGIFSVFAIIVLCLGLLGVILFLTEQKTKEIGVRKCLGETIGSITVRFIRPILISGLIAFLIAVPVSWYTMSLWLENYAYRTHLSIGVFALSGLIALTIALVTVIWQSYHAATRNPVKALRYE
jgi:putative ABC transport system permease protein